jgi:hypothetical protein
MIPALLDRTQMIPALLGYRLRPLPWSEITVAVATVLALTVRRVSAAPGADAELGLAAMACLFGLCGALLTAPETDEGAEPVRCAPLGEWRTVAVRGLVWLAAGLGVLGVLAVALQQLAAWSAAEVLDLTVGPFAFVSVTCAALASRTSAVAGATGGCAIIGGAQLLALRFPEFCLQLLPLAGNPAAGTGWTAGCAAVLAAVTLLDRGRRGLRGIGRGRRADPLPRVAGAVPR